VTPIRSFNASSTSVTEPRLDLVTGDDLLACLIIETKQ
jgi:hypothetical protein